MSAWFFQCNPKHYDIDGALTVSNRIWWAMPQYFRRVSVGDQVALWRCGPAAGVIAVGEVIATSTDQVPSEPWELEFVKDHVAGPSQVPHARLLLHPVRHIPKAVLPEHPELRTNLIIRRPNGTVFPISPDEWDELSLHVEYV